MTFGRGDLSVCPLAGVSIIQLIVVAHGLKQRVVTAAVVAVCWSHEVCGAMKVASTHMTSFDKVFGAVGPVPGLRFA